MSAYFESLNRRTPSSRTANAPAVGAMPVVPEVATLPVPEAAARAVRRVAPGTVPAAYAALRERLLVEAQGKSLKSLVFAGCEGGEGCTQVAREFAEGLAGSGLSVMLVDADLRTSGLTARIPAEGPDLSELVRTKESPPSVACGRGRLAVVPSPVAVKGKESFFRADDLASWLEKVYPLFDYVFLDAPPILRHADGTLASLLCDAVVLVAKGGVTRGDALARARQQIERAGGKVLGVVLNQVRNPVPVFLRRYLGDTE